MKKYIFLDIDGVLATPRTVIDGCWELTPDCQERLGKILMATDAKIVLSSSWRLNTLSDSVEYMSNRGFKFSGHIVGVTIRAYQYIDREQKIHLSIPRGVEIKQWIDANVHSDNGKDWKRKLIGLDYNYVILDDDSDMLLEHTHHFVHTDSTDGLTDADVVKAINILNKT